MGAHLLDPAAAADLLFRRALRRIDGFGADTDYDRSLERFYELAVSDPAVRSAAEALWSDCESYGRPTGTTRRDLRRAFERLARQDGALADRIAEAMATLAGDSPGSGYGGFHDPGGVEPSPSFQPAPAADWDDDEAEDLYPYLGKSDDTGYVPGRLSPPAEDLPAPHRSLVAYLADRAPLDTDLSLVVGLETDTAGWTVAAPLRRLTGYATVSVLVQAPPGLLPTGPLEQVLTVAGAHTVDPVRFSFRTRAPGLHRVRVMAFAGGTFLADLEAEVSVEPGGPTEHGSPKTATVHAVQARPGEVTLQVRSDGERTVFQLLSEKYLFEPVIAQALAAEPPAAVERAIATLKQLASGRGPYEGGMARRWMQETGIGLWDGVVPRVIQEQFWQLRDQITSFTIATSHDVIPWELLYPLRPGSDNGFLVEQFPVLRRVFGQERRQVVNVSPCTYVVSGRAPGNARQEIDTLAAVLGHAGEVEQLDVLLDLLGSGTCGPLHFVCHNSFSPQAGSSIAMTGGPFVPALLNSAAVRRSLAAKSPLVFLNACRTAGTALEYGAMTGWAQQFMAAGAAAFVGTLWPVRSDCASAFAESFYRRLRENISLGRAALLARRDAAQDGPDPTWLAYTVYGDPHAYAN
ncbi:CHAT domain-containing protein [Amycolatopsis sp. K13G38]|uniref:CHAT domain-containing protein n=1 Tax=Amycolatopsis acididurans TaxID=2724524 RepID=A0ABX1IVC7_9PSEU|nr:CHAT domain-containing protein [Amycolatopsis acididurans]NKQ51439.1 CHAT domain-containing protein [Amycolatopsis acididurans]